VSPIGASSLASLDGEITPAGEALIPVADDGLIRGDGAFEVVRIYDGQPFAFEQHMTRLARSGRNLRLPIDLESVRADAYRVLAQAGSGPDHDLLRIVITRGGRRLLLTEALPNTPDHIRLKTVTYAPTRILDGVKSLSYAANMLASRLAREEGFDEALLITPHGRVLEAPTSSIFWVEGEQLLTPPLDEHILASITRGLVMDVAGAEEQTCPIERLRAAEAVFLASTTREVQPVIGVDEISFAPDHAVTARAAVEVEARIRSELAR
jgi:branched-chain amino acid aminotransferase